jgi:hypothetical protein
MQITLLTNPVVGRAKEDGSGTAVERLTPATHFAHVKCLPPTLVQPPSTALRNVGNPEYEGVTVHDTMCSSISSQPGPRLLKWIAMSVPMVVPQSASVTGMVAAFAVTAPGRTKQTTSLRRKSPNVMLSAVKNLSAAGLGAASAIRSGRLSRGEADSLTEPRTRLRGVALTMGTVFLNERCLVVG